MVSAAHRRNKYICFRKEVTNERDALDNGSTPKGILYLIVD